MSNFPAWSQHKSWLVGMLLLIVGCGDGAQFGGGAKQTQSANVTRKDPAPTPPPEDAPDIVSEKSYQTMTWLWQCQNKPEPVPEPSSDRDVVVSGKGPFEFNEEALRGTKVTFSGRLCPPESQPRDIVMVIDTSASMTDNDPRVGDSCGRLKAVQAVVAAIPPGTARFGIVTFNTDLVTSSTMLYDNATALLSAIAPGGSVADVLCLQAGSTNYDAGLNRAGQLLATGRGNASKEIYFVSDGQPNGGQDGIATSTALKSTGVNAGGRNIPVTIGTLMLAGSDTVLQQYIASKDPQGKPLHAFVAQTDDLAKALTNLTSNELVSAVLKYRVIGTKDFTVLNIFDHLKGLEFSLPPISIPAGASGSGVEVVYEYTDKLGQKFSSTGRLILKVTTSPSP